VTSRSEKINFFSQEEMNRGWKYLGVGLVTFLLDLVVLFLLVEFLFVREFIAAGISFFLMTSLNYALNRNFAFAGSDTGVTKGYSFFLLFSIIGIVVTAALMYLLVDVFTINYFMARIPIGIFVSISLYFLNYFFTFNLHKR